MKLAIIEDDINMRKSLEIALGEYDEFEIVSFKNAKDALKKLDDTIDLVITDINMPGIDGIEFLEKLDRKYEAIVITGNATLNRAIDSIRLGVKDFLTKPFEIDTLVEAIKRSQKAIEVTKSKKSQSLYKEDFISSSEALDSALKVAKKAASTDASIMLFGESGVGKELFANFVHKNSKRSEKNFVAINMAAIPENLLESELFGYEKGAFTDATEGRAGKFEASSGGTIFLDEIGEMPLSLQAKILRVLQEREVVRLGSNKPIKVDIRVVSATNANIEQKIKDSEFREDLYFRLQTIPIEIPPLRDRKEEIIPISEWAIKKSAKAYELAEKPLSQNAKERLLKYRWPGNIRELLSVVERAMILSENDEISEEDLFLKSRDGSRTSISNMEKELIVEVLSSAHGDLNEATAILGMNKETLLLKCNKYSIKLGEQTS